MIFAPFFQRNRQSEPTVLLSAIRYRMALSEPLSSMYGIRIAGAPKYRMSFRPKPFRKSSDSLLPLAYSSSVHPSLGCTVALGSERERFSPSPRFLADRDLLFLFCW